MPAKSEPVEREATGSEETVVIEWRDQKFTIPASTDDWSVETTEAFEEGKGAVATRNLLGPKQWAEFKKTKPKNKDLNDLAQLFAEHYGFESAGE